MFYPRARRRRSPGTTQDTPRSLAPCGSPLSQVRGTPDAEADASTCVGLSPRRKDHLCSVACPILRSKLSAGLFSSSSTASLVRAPSGLRRPEPPEPTRVACLRAARLEDKLAEHQPHWFRNADHESTR